MSSSATIAMSMVVSAAARRIKLRMCLYWRCCVLPVVTASIAITRIPVPLRSRRR